jgi:hypothetical protein
MTLSDMTGGLRPKAVLNSLTKYWESRGMSFVAPFAEGWNTDVTDRRCGRRDPSLNQYFKDCQSEPIVAGLLLQIEIATVYT